MSTSIIRYVLISLIIAWTLPGVAGAGPWDAWLPPLTTLMDARVRALGGAGVALPDIARAVDINPALMLEGGYGAAGYSTFTRLPCLGDGSFHEAGQVAVGVDALGVATDSRLTLAFGFQRYDIGDIGSASRAFVFLPYEQSGWVASAGGGLRLKPNLNAGVSLKWIHSAITAIGEDEGSTWGLDVGVYLSGLLPGATMTGPKLHITDASWWQRLQIPRQSGLSIGLSIQNLGPEIEYKETGYANALPRVLNLGASYRLYDSDLLGVLLATQWRQSLMSTDDLLAEDEFTLHWGCEVSLLRIVDVRLGRVHPMDASPGTLTWGVGIGFERIRLDYYKASSDARAIDKTDMWSLNLRL